MKLVYLIHFESPYKHARHYIGFCERGLSSRLRFHRTGRGSHLLRAVTNSGIDWKVARIWRGADRTFERRLKNRKEAPVLCPVCSGRKARQRGKFVSSV